MIKHLVSQNRSYRRFNEDYPISQDDLLQLIDLARKSASGANLQPLRYALSWTADRNRLIFPTLSWAGYLKGWDGPAEGERPSAYIICLAEKGQGRENIVYTDLGIATQSILLGAVERGLGGCTIHSIDRPVLQAALPIPERYQILQVIALGQPKEEVIIEEMSPGGDIKYWRDETDVHHVPKRRLEDIVIEL